MFLYHFDETGQLLRASRWKGFNPQPLVSLNNSHIRFQAARGASLSDFFVPAFFLGVVVVFKVEPEWKQAYPWCAKNTSLSCHTRSGLSFTSQILTAPLTQPDTHGLAG